MNAPVSSVHLKLVLDSALREAVARLDEDAFARFEMAWEAAEHLLGRGAYLMHGSLDYLAPFAGIILAIRFDARRERFVIVAFEDLGTSPDPDGGHRAIIVFAEAALDVVGVERVISEDQFPLLTRDGYLPGILFGVVSDLQRFTASFPSSLQLLAIDMSDTAGMHFVLGGLDATLDQRNFRATATERSSSSGHP